MPKPFDYYTQSKARRNALLALYALQKRSTTSSEAAAVLAKVQQRAQSERV